jgi:hypothetical protein
MTRWKCHGEVATMPGHNSALDSTLRAAMARPGQQGEANTARRCDAEL